ncbi:hypothetical protein F3I35_08680 [Pantoea sp. Bo_7]|uniref:DUF5347 family protein n=1 Tax=unclassified Pantoea TaxID=2630326 RepID=UPI0012325349|nr:MULTISPECIES: DUF5347 family protein [unclassified Pantoea]KAA6048154.1 hypothetical protein F3I35_08680 [Pantoea sp. Bo_7]KAA6093399.1 hypothetical protein F3I22_08685 [Pantoea sp. Bo_10]
MAIEGSAMLGELTAGQRVSALNHLAVIRSQFGGNCEKELVRFFNDMRDVTDSNYHENKRALSAILFLANIGKDRHDVDFSELTTDEKTALIRAMNQLKAVVSLFPKRLALSN